MLTLIYILSIIFILCMLAAVPLMISQYKTQKKLYDLETKDRNYRIIK